MHRSTSIRRPMLAALCGLALILFASSCGTETAQQPAKPVKQYPMAGEVVRLDPAITAAVIKHEQIGDWMDAMTMEFPIKDKQEFAKLAPGQKITATVHVQGVDYWLSDIKVVEKAPGS